MLYLKSKCRLSFKLVFLKVDVFLLLSSVASERPELWLHSSDPGLGLCRRWLDTPDERQGHLSQAQETTCPSSLSSSSSRLRPVFWRTYRFSEHFHLPLPVIITSQTLPGVATLCITICDSLVGLDWSPFIKCYFYATSLYSEHVEKHSEQTSLPPAAHLEPEHVPILPGRVPMQSDTYMVPKPISSTI